MRIPPAATVAVAILFAACAPDVPTAPADTTDLTEVAMAPGSAPETTNTIIDMASGLSDFSLLVAAIREAGLDGVLDGRRQFTVFAPTNAAFQALLDDTGLTLEALLADQDLLTSVLLYHVVPGRRDSGDVVDSERLRTLQGGFLEVELATPVNGLGVFLGDVDPDNQDAEITGVDLFASNGVIHVIDRVLRPADL